MSMKLISPDEMLDHCSSTEYIELMLVRNRYGDGECITLNEALEGWRARDVILFEGNPGIGKSTLAINICKRWSKGTLLQKCDAVILLPLRDPRIQEAKSISDLLQILDDDMRESVFKEIVKNKGEGICFVLEGYTKTHLQIFCVMQLKRGAYKMYTGVHITS